MYLQEEVEAEEEENGDAREFEDPDIDVMQTGTEPASDKPRKTTKYMTKYERARVLGTRALQIRLATGHCVQVPQSPESSFLHVCAE